MKEINIIGMMSGTSLDGLDIAYVRFTHNIKWNYEIICAKTVNYDEILHARLKNAHTLSGLQLSMLHVELGSWMGYQCNQFMEEYAIKKGEVKAVSSHGHTIFHQPDKGLTVQIGAGANIAAITGITTVCDFRTVDVALGGQGAPLVPIGDQLLFGTYTYCLNLGGIANISYEQNAQRISFDCCLANIVSNYLSQKVGCLYDVGGQLAAAGKVDERLLSEMNACTYFLKTPPKSLGKEFFDTEFKRIIDASSSSVEDKLATFAVHLAQQITKFTQSGSLLVTGGGAFNSKWIELLSAHSSVKVVLPSSDTINYKEAIIFAFLGLLRLEGQNNTLPSVTGAQRESCGGAIYKGDE
jgi:anhydro-N-acetylmuramic acid kinase